MNPRTRLERVLGPDLIDLLQSFIVQEIENVLRRRDVERRWLSVAAAADYLGLSEKAVRRRIERGMITYTRHGSRILVDRHALDVELVGQLRNDSSG